MSMDSESPPLRVFIFPFMAPGHMIPMVDMARLLGSHGVRSTVVTTPANQTHISQTIEQARSAGILVDVKTIPFQAAEVGLPDGCENLEMLPSTDLFLQFFQAANLLRGPLEQLLEEEMPDCLISDHFFPWTLDSARRSDIPRIVFHGTSFFAMCAMEMVRVHKPYKSVSSDSELFVIPSLPDEIRMTRTQFAVELWENEDNVRTWNTMETREKLETLVNVGVPIAFASFSLYRGYNEGECTCLYTKNVTLSLAS